MAGQTVNVLLTSFPGLGLPSTLSVPLLADSTINDFNNVLESRLPAIALSPRLILTTSSNQLVHPKSSAPLSSLLPRSESLESQTAILPLRLSTRLCGGKGGFGSQLRAIGGRMSSKKKRNTGPDNGWSRDVNGRRLQTVAEAKALAEYLAIKPEMEKKERDEKRKRWLEIVESSERKQEEIRSGKSGNKGRMDGKWVEAKEEAEERIREAMKRSMQQGEKRMTSEKSKDGSDLSAEISPSEGSESDFEADGSRTTRRETLETRETVDGQLPWGPFGRDKDENVSDDFEVKDNPTASRKAYDAREAADAQQPKAFFGWDEDEDMSSDEDEDQEMPPTKASVIGKGKGKAMA